MYSNCKLFSKDGELLSYIGKRRMDWYLKKGLATQISQSEIRLLFTHSCRAAQPKLYTEVRKNMCVVCGGQNSLTKHHIVPYAFKKHFPLRYKNRTSFDVAILCTECHESYERHADKFKKELMKQYGVTQKSRPYELRIANTLLYHKDSLPYDVYLKMLYSLPEGVTDDPASLEAFINSYEDIDHNINQLLVSKVPVIDDFIIAWRKHFVEYAQPKYMPDSWHEEIEFVYTK
jgi:hypothetical protein